MNEQQQDGTSNSKVTEPDIKVDDEKIAATLEDMQDALGEDYVVTYDKAQRRLRIVTLG